MKLNKITKTALSVTIWSIFAFAMTFIYYHFKEVGIITDYKKSWVDCYEYDFNLKAQVMRKCPTEEFIWNGRKIIFGIASLSYFVLLIVTIISIWYEQLEKEVNKKTRCCGRCDGVNDICVSDMVCEKHKKEGCEICYGKK